MLWTSQQFGSDDDYEEEVAFFAMLDLGQVKQCYLAWSNVHRSHSVSIVEHLEEKGITDASQQIEEHHEVARSLMVTRKKKAKRLPRRASKANSDIYLLYSRYTSFIIDAQRAI